MSNSQDPVAPDEILPDAAGSLFRRTPLGAAPAPAKQARPRVRGQRVDDVPAFLIHSYPYRETSLILDVFTRSHGRLALVAKGAKRPHSALRPVLIAFQRLSLSWSGAGEIKTLVRAEWFGAPQRLQGAAAMSGWYLNELLLRLLGRDDPHESLYDAYVEALSRLAAHPRLSGALRAFEWRLLCEIGYGFDPAATGADEPVRAGARYRVPLEAGPEQEEPEAPQSGTPITGESLLALAEGRFDDVAAEPELRRLLRERLDYHMNGRPMSTRQVLHDLRSFPPLRADARPPGGDAGGPAEPDPPHPGKIADR
ncbi:DNA repair protein RecO [Pigmentiphaga sp. H8]|uniref:DNA repair protein RecO n=1 Tax=unclassified Pigmentiphaga TaxID=2626614 RepID=UPI000F5A247C|nr:DNA repair protein RecO [Pigmentiphaga sp. H8]AZG09206.1 DNA repair protein RecO [Pigmentiphaga sp. H8]